MRTVFLSVFCLSFPGLMALAHNPERKPPIEEKRTEKDFNIKDLGFFFQRIEPGSFTMGSPRSEAGRDADEDQVEVTISKPFKMLATAVTQKQYLEVMGKRAAFFKSKKLVCEERTLLI